MEYQVVLRWSIVVAVAAALAACWAVSAAGDALPMLTCIAVNAGSVAVLSGTRPRTDAEQIAVISRAAFRAGQEYERQTETAAGLRSIDGGRM